MRKLYRVLDVSPNVSDEDLKAAYRAAVLKFHPDRGHAGAVAREEAEFKFREAQAAFDDLVAYRQKHGPGTPGSSSSHDPLNRQRAQTEQTRDSSRSHDVRSGHRAAGPAASLLSSRELPAHSGD